jgi:glyoxylase-like metal-dependent hydrolase (beta-lactamase superfamily II)
MVPFDDSSPEQFGAAGGTTQALGKGVTLIDTGYLRPAMAGVYLVREGGRAALIETGTARTLPRVLSALQALGVSTNSVDYIIPTHVHLDHAGGAGQLMALCPNAKLVVHPAGARHLIDPTRLVQGVAAVYGERRFRELYGEVLPVDAARVIEASDDFTLDFAGRLLRFLDTPGHARHHFCVLDTASQGIFAGDTLGLCYPDLDTPAGPFALPTTTPVQFEPEALTASIDRLASLGAATAYLTHFGAVELTQAYIRQLKTDIAAFTCIAREEATPVDERAARIEKRLMAYLLERLAAMGGRRAHEEYAALLDVDVRLNAQGLDVWLSRRMPASE